MIHYTLACDHGHQFEGWFRSSADFDGQSAGGLLSCPVCASSAVTKALMAPNVVTREARTARSESEPAAGAAAEQAAAVPTTQVALPGPMVEALSSPEGQAFVAHLREMKAKLLENSENVGRGFAEEARRIHYGEAPVRPVHGQATAEEARDLLEEGVDILPLPILPDERN